MFPMLITVKANADVTYATGNVASFSALEENTGTFPPSGTSTNANLTKPTYQFNYMKTLL